MKPDKIIISLLLLIFLTTLSWITSCTHTADISDVPEVCFTRDVLPVFLNSCALADCHDGTGESDLLLTNYHDILEGVKPGDPGDSEIYKSITAKGGEDMMPPDQPLSTDNRVLIRFWIEQGAIETTCQ
jgi:hypothetical protein